MISTREKIKNEVMTTYHMSSKDVDNLQLPRLLSLIEMKNKAIYKELRETNYMSLPSPDILYKKQPLLRPSPGVDPRTMHFIKDLKQRTKGKIKGHVMMDEIKLKNGIMWNCMNNVITGYIEEDLNTKDIMMDILGLSPTKKNVISK